jgi:glycosyltransferase involved in cell wall biosynthesis
VDRLSAGLTMERIRVMQLVAGLAVGDQLGGAELFGLQLARYLDRDLFDVMVCGLWQYDSPREREWLERLKVDAVDATLLVTPTGRLWHDLQVAFSRLWSTVSDFQPDVINSYSERSDVFNMLLHVLHPVRPHAIRTMQTDQQWQRRPWAGAILGNMVYPLGFNLEIGTSQAICQVLDARHLAHLIRKKSTLCYSGIDESMLERRAPQVSPTAVVHRDTRGQLCIGVIGRLSQQKGHIDLLEAMQIIHQSVPADLFIIGSGELEKDLRETVMQGGLQDRVHFLGSRNDVFDIMASLDLVVSSSWWEGFPTVLLEAMALGVPVVATDVSGSRELIRTGETGVLVPPHSPGRLAEAIVWMLAHPEEAHAMAERGRQTVASFTIQNAARLCAVLYGRIAGHPVEAAESS